MVTVIVRQFFPCLVYHTLLLLYSKNLAPRAPLRPIDDERRLSEGETGGRIFASENAYATLLPLTRTQSLRQEEEETGDPPCIIYEIKRRQNE